MPDFYHLVEMASFRFYQIDVEAVAIIICLFKAIETAEMLIDY